MMINTSNIFRRNGTEAFAFKKAMLDHNHPREQNSKGLCTVLSLDRAKTKDINQNTLWNSKIPTIPVYQLAYRY